MSRNNDTILSDRKPHRLPVWSLTSDRLSSDVLLSGEKGGPSKTVESWFHHVWIWESRGKFWVSLLVWKNLKDFRSVIWSLMSQELPCNSCCYSQNPLADERSKSAKALCSMLFALCPSSLDLSLPANFSLRPFCAILADHESQLIFPLLQRQKA